MEGSGLWRDLVKTVMFSVGRLLQSLGRSICSELEGMWKEATISWFEVLFCMRLEGWQNRRKASEHLTSGSDETGLTAQSVGCTEAEEKCSSSSSRRLIDVTSSTRGTSVRDLSQASLLWWLTVIRDKECCEGRLSLHRQDYLSVEEMSDRESADVGWNVSVALVYRANTYWPCQD